MIPAAEALARLKEGNLRFASNVRAPDRPLDHDRRAELAESQEPFAIILGCSDSRVPSELVFDQGLGDLFVIEFAASQFAVRLVVVMGHTKCGAIAATIEELKRPIGTQSRNLRSIVDRIRPWVQTLMETPLRHDHDALLTHSVRANVRASVNHLKHASEVLEDLIDNHGLMVVGAEYSLETGVVEFLDEEYATTPPAGSRE